MGLFLKKLDFEYYVEPIQKAFWGSLNTFDKICDPRLIS